MRRDALCGQCIKYADVPCGLHRVFLLLAPACIVLALMPLGADCSWPPTIPRRSERCINYSHPVVYQYFELLYCPAVAVAMLGVSLGILLLKRNDPLPAAKLAFAAGVGPMGFALFRMLVTGPYGQNLVWRNFWEEATELLFIVGVCYVLWLFPPDALCDEAGSGGECRVNGLVAVTPCASPGPACYNRLPHRRYHGRAEPKSPLSLRERVRVRANRLEAIGYRPGRNPAAFARSSHPPGRDPTYACP